jgi:hypothetical protein
VLQVEQRELGLQRVDVADRLASLDLLPAVVRETDPPDEALIDQPGHRFPGLLERDRSSGPVELVEVDPLDAQPLETSLAGAAHLFSAEPRARRSRSDLGGDKDFVTPALYRTTDDGLRSAAAVDLRGVDPVDPGVDPRMDGLDHPLLRVVRTVRVPAGLPRAEADDRELGSLRAEALRLHMPSLPRP